MSRSKFKHKKNIILEIGSGNTANVFKEDTDEVVGIHKSDILYNNPEDIKLVVFTGGEDVDPSLYGEPRGKYTHFNIKRDEHERHVFEYAKKNGIPMAGVCRGAQFLCVMNGGKLCQDLTSHAGQRHQIKTHTGDLISVNSAHHQMMLPPDNAQVLATAEPPISHHYWNGENADIQPQPQEIEAVYFPETKSLGVQWHPEWLGDKDPACQYAAKLVKEFIFDKEKV